MPKSAKLAILLACAPCTLGACSRGASTLAAGAAAASPAFTTAATGAAPAASACDRRLVSARDAAAILGAPIVVTKDLQGDPQSCTFKTADFHSLTVSVRPALGKATVDTWAAGKMGTTATPLAGVGDRAVWVEDLGEVDAQKDDLLCVASAPGLRRSLGDPHAAASSRKLGALCNQVFAGS
ncbi:MAG TPA: hypothetical protein VKY89_07930 [Thermoanaerobaculia bacterium]|nr:hypothetical protein [Thermoanaerobaculia bacterium]